MLIDYAIWCYARFTWDQWVVENDHILGVEIENETVSYNIDKIKDYQPIKIRESADENNKKVELFCITDSLDLSFHCFLN